MYTLSPTYSLLTRYHIITLTEMCENNMELFVAGCLILISHPTKFKNGSCHKFEREECIHTIGRKLISRPIFAPPIPMMRSSLPFVFQFKKNKKTFLAVTVFRKQFKNESVPRQRTPREKKRKYGQWHQRRHHCTN